MTGKADAASMRPNAWLRELTRLKPARWRAGQSVRSAISIAGPVVAGMLAGSPSTFMWMSFGALGLCLGEHPGPFRPLFRQAALVALFGALGFLASFLADLPWPAVVAAMAAAAFVSGIVSSRGPAFSAAMLRMLMMATIAIGIPGIGPVWKPMLLFIAGCAFYAALLGIEALIVRKQPLHKLVGDLLGAVGDLARARAAGVSAEEEDALRRDVTGRMAEAYADLLDSRYYSPGRSAQLDRRAAILQAVNALFAAVLASGRPPALAQTAEWLDRAVAAVEKGGPRPPAGPGAAQSPLLAKAAEDFTQTYWPPAVGETSPRPTRTVEASRRPLGSAIGSLPFGPETIRSSAVLALCIAIAFSTRWLNDTSHWYWTPLTVTLVFRPDLGSVFARTVLRCLGTALGVVMGAAFFVLLPKGVVLGVVLGLLAAALPWTAQRSYWLMSFNVTPAILILIDLVSPGGYNTDYGAQRLLDTLLGGAIVLVFGYFLWPKSRSRHLSHAFAHSRRAVADYLAALADCGGDRLDPDLLDCRHRAYAALAAMRKSLENAAQEPPPAGREAAAWLPAVTCIERICAGITAWSARGEVPPDRAGEIRTLARMIAGEKVSGSPTVAGDPDGNLGGGGISTLAGTIVAELNDLSRLTLPEDGA